MRRTHLGVLASSVAVAAVGAGIVTFTAGRHHPAGPPLCATRVPVECSETMARAWNLPLASVPRVRTPHGLRFVNAFSSPGIGINVKTMEFVAAPADFHFFFVGPHDQHIELSIDHGNATAIAHLRNHGTFVTRSGRRYFGIARSSVGYCVPSFTDSRFVYNIQPTGLHSFEPGTPACDRVDALVDSITPPPDSAT